MPQGISFSKEVSDSVVAEQGAVSQRIDNGFKPSVTVVDVPRCVPGRVGLCLHTSQRIVGCTCHASQRIHGRNELSKRIIEERGDITVRVCDRGVVTRCVVLVTRFTTGGIDRASQPARCIVYVGGHAAKGVGLRDEVAHGVVNVGSDSSQGIHCGEQAADQIVSVPCLVSVCVDFQDTISDRIVPVLGDATQRIGHIDQVAQDVVLITSLPYWIDNTAQATSLVIDVAGFVPDRVDLTDQTSCSIVFVTRRPPQRVRPGGKVPHAIVGVRVDCRG